MIVHTLNIWVRDNIHNVACSKSQGKVNMLLCGRT